MERSLDKKTNETPSERVMGILRLVGVETNETLEAGDLQTQLLLEYIESETGVIIPERDAMNLITPQDYITYVRDHGNQQTY